MDGNYIVFDTKRNRCIRGGMVKVEMKGRWKEHISASLRNTAIIVVNFVTVIQIKIVIKCISQI